MRYKKKNSKYKKGYKVIIKITRFGFIKGEVLTVLDSEKDSDHAIEVSNGKKTHRVPTKYLD